MTFLSEETRDQYHRLETGTQVSLELAERTLRSYGQYLHVSAVEGSEVIIRVHKDPVLGLHSLDIESEHS